MRVILDNQIIPEKGAMDVKVNASFEIKVTADEARRVHGFRTGDLVRARMPGGKQRGLHTGRVAVRTTGRFNLSSSQGTVQGIRWQHCCLIHRADGYAYSVQTRQAASLTEPTRRRRSRSVRPLKQAVSAPKFL